jgi:FSR family fosmidomycin resistance protein-like MFS transporter
VFGAWTAAWPLIRDDLGLSYVQVGVLLSLPHVFGSLLEPPLGLLGDGWNRRALVRAGAVSFCLALALVAVSDGFAPLLLALMLLSPASGTFVGLSQAVLMDLEPRRHEQNMARWALAGSIGVVAGPLALGWGAAAGVGWRGVFAAFAVFALAAAAAVWRVPMPNGGDGERTVAAALGDSARGAARALRRREVLRWLTLLQFSDLTLDVLHGFLALYFIDVVGASGAGATLAIVVWTGVGLAGDALVIPLLERVDGVLWVRATAALAVIVFPAFLCADDPALKLALLGTLGVLNSGWYPVLKGRLYSALPGQSATVMALGSLFGIAGGLLPLAIGAVAQRAGLGVAMWLLLAGPAALLLGVPRRGTGGRGPSRPLPPDPADAIARDGTPPRG